MTTHGRRAWLLLIAVLSFVFAPNALAQGPRPTFRIMFIADGESTVLSERQAMLQEEILELAKDDANVVFVEPKVKPNWTLESSTTALKSALADRSIDLVIISGAMTGVAVGRIPKLSKPVLIPYAAPELQGLPQAGNQSGRKNLAYIAGLLNFEREIRTLRDIVRFDRMALIVGEEVIEHLDAPEQPVQTASQHLGIETRLVIATADAQQTIDAIPRDTEAVYIGPLFKWSDEEKQRLIDGLNAQGLASYAGAGVKWV
jgi:hypothetical protein